MTYSTSPQYQHLVVTMYIHHIFRIVSEASLEKSMTRLVAVFFYCFTTFYFITIKATVGLTMKSIINITTFNNTR